MRVALDKQMKLGQLNIANIDLNINSRDDIPAALLGIQFIYKNKKIRSKVLDILEQYVAPKISKKKGRKGLDLWYIFVLGTLRTALNIDYDRLHEYANSHIQIRQMLGLSDSLDSFVFSLGRIKKNVSLLSEEIINKINTVIVKAGHNLFSNEKASKLRCRADSFVVKTNVHFPTDITLLEDALRNSIIKIATLANRLKLSSWRQYKYNLAQLDKLKWKAQNSKKTKVKRETDLEKYTKRVIKPHIKYIKSAQKKVDRVEETLDKIDDKKFENEKKEIQYFLGHAKRQIEQIERRVVYGEKIPHSEKVFSVYKPYTEWIVKGKAGVPMELGIRVAVVEDHLGFILNHKVMEKQTDEKVTQSLVHETKNIFDNVESISFDKGFYSPENQEKANQMVENLYLPKKGKLSKDRREIENAADFKKARKSHSAIESAINALEVHGLDICPDYGIDRFKTYVALAVLSRNILQIGFILRKKAKRKKLRRKKPPRVLEKIAA